MANIELYQGDLNGNVAALPAAYDGAYADFAQQMDWSNVAAIYQVPNALELYQVGYGNGYQGGTVVAVDYSQFLTPNYSDTSGFGQDLVAAAPNVYVMAMNMFGDQGGGAYNNQFGGVQYMAAGLPENTGGGSSDREVYDAAESFAGANPNATPGGALARIPDNGLAGYDSGGSPFPTFMDVEPDGTVPGISVDPWGGIAFDPYALEQEEFDARQALLNLRFGDFSPLAGPGDTPA